VDWTPEQRARRPVQEYLVALESENPPINPDQKPKAMSPSDPSAAWTTRARHKVMFGYSLNYLIDMEGSVILDVEATPTRISKEVDATETMIERTEERFALKPKHLAGDVAYERRNYSVCATTAFVFASTAAGTWLIAPHLLPNRSSGEIGWLPLCLPEIVYALDGIG
jgi:hypothetical protein